MNDDQLLGQLTIAEPCVQDWSALPGDERVRFCAACGKHVYNLGIMPAAEAACLIRARAGNLCAVLPAQGEPSQAASRLQPPVSRGQFHIRFIMTVIAGVGTVLGLTRSWWRSEAPAVAPRVNATMIRGKIACPPSLLLPPSADPVGTEPSAEAYDGPALHEAP